MVGIASLMLALAAQGAASVPPPDANRLPAIAVAHVAVMDERRADCSNCPTYRRTIMRSGNWVKDERVRSDGSETVYSDFASGTSFTLYRNREGAAERLVVERNLAPDPRWVIRRERTGRRDSGQVEPCEIWTLTDPDYQLENCETADGILLRSSQLGRIVSQAVSIERRPVRPQEVRPPADLFASVQWPRLERGLPGSAGGYEVRLTSRSRGAEQAKVLRSQGNLTSSREEGRRGEGRFFWASDGTSSYLYQVDGRGRAYRLEAGLPTLRLLGSAPGWEAVPGRAPQRLLGEGCTWQEETSIESTDAQYECRTADGVPLMLEYRWDWDSVIDIYRARSVVRRPLAEADLAPPPEARDWASWGVAPPGPEGGR